MLRRRNHRWLWTVMGRHIADAGIVALALTIREFMGNGRNIACHSHELGREGGWCQHSLEPPSVCVHGGHEALGEPIVWRLLRGRYIPSG